MTRIKQIFVNLAVKDLDKSVAFFSKLGFSFNPEFTDSNATCMIIGENIYAMLLVEPFFQSFLASKTVSDAHKTTEVLLALSADHRTEVDALMEKALSAGAREPRPAQDHGWMYARSFEDLDGHIWETFYMDETQKPKA
jgi:predicted lactoylglutathione lyase